MFRPEFPRSRFGKPNFILGWIAGVDSEISIIDLLGVDCRKFREKESKQNRTNPVHIIAPVVSTTIPCRDISWMQSRTALFRIGNTSHNRGLGFITLFAPGVSVMRSSSEDCGKLPLRYRTTLMDSVPRLSQIHRKNG
jgi:hypothetical protein